MAPAKVVAAACCDGCRRDPRGREEAGLVAVGGPGRLAVSISRQFLSSGSKAPQQEGECNACLKAISSDECVQGWKHHLAVISCMGMHVDVQEAKN
ncbi:Os02g0142875 [Oryza sativa Japonica Group]|uniref:Os02g0142875 protein n=1 Tax=Oryza sativa subsp. japonica TaxID=39947 RepID=A0A0N7KEN8_ORYSJ|nr:Os02g0142875 [Oryza sativa Japonica Group]